MNVSGEGVYAVSGHADWRIYDRKVPTIDIYNALYNGRAILQANGCTMHYDNHTGIGVVVCHRANEIITVMHLKRKQVKRYFSK